MRYAVFTDVHANLEALEAVLAKIDELAQQEPIDQIWFLGDLVGYGPNPNECIVKLRERTDVIIAGNHDWAAVNKIDLDDFSTAARISAEWTAKQLTKEHFDFLANLPERVEIGECTLVHGSPYGPLWEYLTSEALAERSFEHFTSPYCLVGHTHVPIIFQQPDTANIPTIPLGDTEQHEVSPTSQQEGEEQLELSVDDETVKMVAVRPMTQTATTATPAEQALAETASSQSLTTPDTAAEVQKQTPEVPSDDIHSSEEISSSQQEEQDRKESTEQEEPAGVDAPQDDVPALSTHSSAVEERAEVPIVQVETQVEQTTPEETIASAEDSFKNEIEELLSLLGLSRSLIQVTNEMIVPHEGLWQPPEGYRAIINPGGVGQPRDGDPRAAFMIYDTERGFTFYRVPYAYEKTQEKIIEAGLPSYLAARLAYGR